MAKELGRIGQRRYSGVFFEEFLHELRGAKGAEIYTEMADNDSTIGAIFFATENLMRNCDFTIEPGGNTAKDKEAAEFVDGCLHDMCNTWTDTLSEILSFIPYGWSYHEIVYKRRMGKKPNSADSSKYDDGLIGWKKLPIRSQETLYEWVYKDHTDDLLGMRQMVVTDTDIVDVVIPIEKAMHFITRSRKNNPEGRSVLRTAYRDWYFKKRIMEIEGIGIERDLAGFPTLIAPEGLDLWDSEDPEMVAALNRAEAIITGIRRDSREGLVLPNGWELNLLSTGSRRQFDTNQIIERYNKQIATSVLTDFVLLGHESVGSFALADNKTKMFSLAVGTYLDIICEVFNNQAIPRLIDINGDHFKGITDYPQMKHGDIEDANLEKIGNFIQQMVGVGALTPDDDIEDYLRKIANLPESKVSIPYEERKGEMQEQEPQDPQNPEGMTEEGMTGGAGGKSKTATMYEIKSIMTDYLRGNMPKQMAEDMLRKIGIDDEKISFYMSEYDNLRTENENKKMAEKAGKDGKSGKEMPKPTPSEESRKEKAKEEKAEKDPDELQDEKEAEEAKKSLGRGEAMPTFNDLLYGAGNVKKAQTFSEILKYNPYHDARGRFTSGGSAASFVANPNTKAGANAISREKSISAAVESHKQGDKDAIAGNIEKVKASVSNTSKPLERQKVDIDKIMKEGGCDRATAKKAAAEAKAIYDKVSKAEPQITADIVGAVSANNGKMYGLDYRMKQETSLARKIASDAKGEFNGDIKAAAAEVKDAVRYTAVFDTNNFTQGYKNVKQSLEAKGYKEDRCKNFFADYAEGTSVQKAVQCVYSDKNGNRLELQFHTYNSQGAKEVNHPLYEQSRAASTSKTDKVILNRRMINISSNVPDPDGVMSIERHK